MPGHTLEALCFSPNTTAPKNWSHKEPTIFPAFWSVDELISHGDDVIYELACKTTGTITSCKVLVGRCLLAMEETKLYEKFSMSGASPETEELWLKLCEELNCRQVRTLVTLTPKGGMPGDLPNEDESHGCEYRCRFSPQLVIIIERVLRQRSQKEVCSGCHKKVHEKKLFITGTPEQGFTFTDTEGLSLNRLHRLEKAAWLDYWIGWTGGAHERHASRVG